MCKTKSVLLVLFDVGIKKSEKQLKKTKKNEVLKEREKYKKSLFDIFQCYDTTLTEKGLQLGL